LFSKEFKAIDRKVFVLVFFEQNIFRCSTFSIYRSRQMVLMKEATAEFERSQSILMLSMKIINEKKLLIII
jgi:hypothetical protein